MFKFIIFLLSIILQSNAVHAFFPPIITEKKTFEEELSESGLPKTTQDLLRHMRRDILFRDLKYDGFELTLVFTDDCFSNNNFFLIPNSFFNGFKNVYAIRIRVYEQECLRVNFDQELHKKTLELRKKKYLPNLKTIDLQFTLYDKNDLLVQRLKRDGLTVLTEEDMLLSAKTLHHCCFHKFDKNGNCPGCGEKRSKDSDDELSDMYDFELDLGDDGEE